MKWYSISLSVTYNALIMYIENYEVIEKVIKPNTTGGRKHFWLFKCSHVSYKSGIFTERFKFNMLNDD